MALAMKGWLRAGRLRDRVRRGRQGTTLDRRRLVRELAPGRAFIDVGGMWGIDGEIAFLAEEAGATDVVLLDGMDPSPPFLERHRRTGSAVRYVQGDLHDPITVAELGAFEVVWCTGVIYHSPNPYLLVEHLRALTRERLLLGSVTVPEVPGLPQACVFCPGIPEPARRAFAAGFGARGAGLLGMAAPFDRTPLMGYSNTWWGLTPSAIAAMLDAARFRVLATARPEPLALDVLAEPVAGDSVIPPPDFSRERGHRRAG